MLQITSVIFIKVMMQCSSGLKITTSSHGALDLSDAHATFKGHPVYKGRMEPIDQGLAQLTGVNDNDIKGLFEMSEASAQKNYSQLLQVRDAENFSTTSSYIPPSNFVGGFGGASYVGCYTDNGNRDLNNYQTWGQTLEECANLCFPTYKYLGLQSNGQCRCDNAYATSSAYVAVDDSQCFNRTDNFIGGNWRNAIFKEGEATTTTTTLPPPPANPGVGGDPHVTTLDGRKFDILQVGSFALLTIKRIYSLAKSPDLAVHAAIDHVEGSCSATFIQNVSLSGNWLDGKNSELGVRVVHWVPAEEALQVRFGDLNPDLKRFGEEWHPVSYAKDHSDIVTKVSESQIRFLIHGVTVRITLGLNKRMSDRNKGYNFLNVNVGGLNALPPNTQQAGILAGDDVSAISAASASCHPHVGENSFIRETLGSAHVQDYNYFLSSISAIAEEDDEVATY